MIHQWTRQIFPTKEIGQWLGCTRNSQMLLEITSGQNWRHFYFESQVDRFLYEPDCSSCVKLCKKPGNCTQHPLITSLGSSSWISSTTGKENRGQGCRLLRSLSLEPSIRRGCTLGVACRGTGRAIVPASPETLSKNWT
jgi:hypothetical protein